MGRWPGCEPQPLSPSTPVQHATGITHAVSRANETLLPGSNDKLAARRPLRAQVCQAVAHMHRFSPPYAHRDIKAENVLKNSSGRWGACGWSAGLLGFERRETQQHGWRGGRRERRRASLWARVWGRRCRCWYTFKSVAVVFGPGCPVGRPDVLAATHGSLLLCICLPCCNTRVMTGPCDALVCLRAQSFATLAAPRTVPRCACLTDQRQSAIVC